MNLTKNSDIREVLAPVSAASSTDSNTDILDMSGYDGVVFIVPITASAATGVATLTVEQSDDNADTNMAATTLAPTYTCTTNDDLNNKLLVADCYKPTGRYVQANLVSAEANIAFGNVIAILYKSSKGPISKHSSILDLDLAISPAEA